MARRGKKTGSTKRQSIREKARQAAQERERGSGGLDTLKDIPQEVEFFKPKAGRGEKGENYFSIVPYIVSIENHPYQTPDDLWHECTYWQHKVGSGDDQKRFICPTKTIQAKDNRCPICDYRAALIKSGEDPDLAEELKPKVRQLFNILDHDDEDKGIQLFEISPWMFGHMLDDEDAAQSEKRFDGKFYGDPEDGLAVLARFSAEKFAGNPFQKIARIDFEERDNLTDAEIEEAVDLDACLRILPFDEMEAKFFELDTGESEQVEEQKPEPEKKTGSRRRKPKETKESEPETRSRKTEATIPEKDQDSEDTTATDKCPNDLVFGVDSDADDVCDTCKVWDDCKDEKDRLEAEKAANKKSSGRSRKR